VTAALEVVDLRVRLGGSEVVQGVSLAVGGGEVLGLVGPNGAGKTTVVDAVTGFVPATGAVTVDGRRAEHLRPHRRAGLGLARTFQSLELFDDLTVGENLAVAAEAARRRDRATVARAAERAGVGHLLAALPSHLSLGQRKSVALARALAAGPSVVLLDEPAAGLDGRERRALAATVAALAAEGTAVVLIDHDVRLVLEVSDRVAVLDGGSVVAAGPPADLLGEPAVAAAWLGPATHHPRPAPPGGRHPGTSGPPVLELHGVSAGWGGVAVVHDVDLAVGAGEVVALLGANGAGKTTTLLTAGGSLAPLAGTVSAAGAPVSGTVDRIARRGVAHAPQGRGLLPSLTVAEQLRLAAGRGRAGRGAVAGAVDRLPALRPLLGRRAGLLSGGEQQQLSLARAVAARPRVLLVDELSLGLAPALVEECLGLLRRLADEEGVGVLLVEQFAPLALSVADRAAVLHRGRVVASGPAAELARRPDVLAAAYLGDPVSGPPAGT
jgi:branched-chain amino acid transport system ATP-binding protein